MSSSEVLLRQPSSAIRYRPLHPKPLPPGAKKRMPASRQSQHAITADPTQIMPGWCFVALGMLISFVLLYAGAVFRQSLAEKAPRRGECSPARCFAYPKENQQTTFPGFRTTHQF